MLGADGLPQDLHSGVEIHRRQRRHRWDEGILTVVPSRLAERAPRHDVTAWQPLLHTAVSMVLVSQPVHSGHCCTLWWRHLWQNSVSRVTRSACFMALSDCDIIDCSNWW